MDARTPEPLIDARIVRFELAAMAVVLLGVFVFRWFWAIPGLAVVLAVGIGLGRRANLFDRVFEALASGRLRPVSATEAATEVKVTEFFALAVLTVASVLLAFGWKGTASVIGLFEGGVCALHATTGVSIEAAARDRLLGRRRRTR